MSTTSRAAAVIAAATLALAAACGGATDDNATPSASLSSSPATEQPTSTNVPDEAALTAALLTAEDLGEGWRELGTGDEPILPGLGLPCPDDTSDPAAPQWQVGTRFTMEVAQSQDVYSPPILGQYLLADDPTALAETYATLRTALMACAGEAREDEGDAYTISTTDVVDLDGTGDEALMLSLREAGVGAPGDAVVTDGRMVLVRSGATLMKLFVFEGTHVAHYTGQAPDQIVSGADLDGIVSTTVAKLD